jgi:hypothetical protein
MGSLPDSDLLKILVAQQLAQQRAKALADALAPQEAPPLSPTAIAAALRGPTAPTLFGNGGSRLFGSSTPGLGGILSERSRRRYEWEQRFDHWEESESDAETQRIERARNMVQQALSQNQWLHDHGVTIVRQGSFWNRTNARLDTDIDLRAQHPYIRIEYAAGVNAEAAYRAGEYIGMGARSKILYSR